MQRHKGGQGSHARQLIKWQELTLGVAVVAACLGFFAVRAARAAPAALARIYLDGEQVREVALQVNDDYRIDELREQHGVPVSFEVRGGAIRFVDVTCPDHICEKTGFVSSDGQTAVCMPNRVSVIVVAEW